MDIEKQMKMLGNMNPKILKDMRKQMMGGKSSGVDMSGLVSNVIGGVNQKIKKWFKKNMKKIVIIIVVVLTLIIGTKIMLSEEKGLYLVTDSFGEQYNTNDYKIDGQCVKFKRNKKKREITVCGNFKIVKQQTK
jgi:hypothetical protein